MFIKSEEIKVFPSSKRNDGCDRNARLNSEQNLISIVNRLTDSNGFIISGLTYDGSKLGSGSCNIGGYYFNITKDITVSAGSSDNVLYLQASITNGELVGSDLTSGTNSGKYNGLAINLSNSIPEGNGILVVAQKISNTWVPYEFSSIRYDVSSIGAKSGGTQYRLLDYLNDELVIDDGEI